MGLSLHMIWQLRRLTRLLNFFILDLMGLSPSAGDRIDSYMVLLSSKFLICIMNRVITGKMKQALPKATASTQISMIRSVSD